jgi:ketosteroid isomerase-like protein
MSTRDIVIAYIRAIESHDLEDVTRRLHDDVVVVEHPNKLNVTTKTYDKAAIRAAGERGAAMLEREQYEIRSAIVEGERAALSMVWTGTLKNGTTMRADICSVVELRDGLVWRQEQYDCFT